MWYASRPDPKILEKLGSYAFSFELISNIHLRENIIFVKTYSTESAASK